MKDKAMDTNNNKALEAIKASIGNTDSQEVAELKAALAAAKAENEALQAKKSTGGIKLTEKGGVSVYGLGRFPVTLYRSQWEQLFDRVDDIKAFIVKHQDKLAAKPGQAETQDKVKVG